MGITCKMNADQNLKAILLSFYFKKVRKKNTKDFLVKKKSMRILYKMNSDQI